MEGLNMLPQNGFRVRLQHIYSRCQKCIFAQMGYFVGNVASMIVLFSTSQKYSDSVNILKLLHMLLQKLKVKFSGTWS